MELEEQEQDVEMQEEDDTTGQALSAIQRDQTMGKLTDEFMKQLSDHKRFDSHLFLRIDFIDPIDVSNLRRFSSRRNRIGSNRTNVTKSTVQPGFEYTFFALTLNPTGKTRCLEIEDYAGGYAAKVQSNKSTPSLSKHSFGIGSHSLRAYCLPRENLLKAT